MPHSCEFNHISFSIHQLLTKFHLWSLKMFFLYVQLSCALSACFPSRSQSGSSHVTGRNLELIYFSSVLSPIHFLSHNLPLSPPLWLMYDRKPLRQGLACLSFSLWNFDLGPILNIHLVSKPLTFLNNQTLPCILLPMNQWSSIALNTSLHPESPAVVSLPERDDYVRSCCYCYVRCYIWNF